MLLFLLFGFFATADAACSVRWPNNTDTAVHWWPCNSSPVTFSNFQTLDQNGNPGYPLNVDGPILMKVDIHNPSYTFVRPNLRISGTVWYWGGFLGCGWHSLPTFGLIDNLDACDGAPCPIYPGDHTLSLSLDVSKFKAIIDILNDDEAYQVELIVEDTYYNTRACLMGQARVQSL